MTSLAKLLEAALFAAARPISLESLATLDVESSPAALAAAIDELREHYEVDGHGVELVAAGRYSHALNLRKQLSARRSPCVPRDYPLPRWKRWRSSPIASRSAAQKSKRFVALPWEACSSHCTNAGSLTSSGVAKAWDGHCCMERRRSFSSSLPFDISKNCRVPMSWPSRFAVRATAL